MADLVGLKAERKSVEICGETLTLIVPNPLVRSLVMRFFSLGFLRYQHSKKEIEDWSEKERGQRLKPLLDEFVRLGKDLVGYSPSAEELLAYSYGDKARAGDQVGEYIRFGNTYEALFLDPETNELIVKAIVLCYEEIETPEQVWLLSIEAFSGAVNHIWAELFR